MIWEAWPILVVHMPNASQELKPSGKEQTNMVKSSETDVLAFRLAHWELSDLVYPALLFVVYILMSGDNWCISKCYLNSKWISAINCLLLFCSYCICQQKHLKWRQITLIVLCKCLGRGLVLVLYLGGLFGIFFGWFAFWCFGVVVGFDLFSLVW